jgi:hypothetical protein
MREPEFKKAFAIIEKDDLYAPDMYDYCDGFAVYCLEVYNELKGKGLDPVLFTEDKVDLTKWVPFGFGTVDVRIVADGMLFVFDFKYGKGVPVFAEDNTQLKLYALGAYEEMSHLYEINTVALHVYQPRIDNVGAYLMTVPGLLKWADEYLVPRARMAYAGEGDFVPGSHCQFCRIKPKCRALASYNLELAKKAFEEPATLSPDEIAEIVQKEKFFSDWLSAVTTHALDQALNHGVKWPGLKLVEGRSIRKYTDDGLVSAALLNAGLKDEDIYKPLEVKGITEITKIVGKTDFERILGGLVHKPPGKPILAPAEDKRPEFNPVDRAKAAFKDE